MADFPLATRLLLSIDKPIVRFTGQSLFMKLFAQQQGLDKNPDFKPVPPVLLLTKGRKSGRIRGAVLPLFTFDGLSFVVGSKGGMPQDPAWVQNLRSDPRARVYLHRKRHDATARIADAEERGRLWPKLIAHSAVYADYQKNTSREIPLVILDLKDRTS